MVDIAAALASSDNSQLVVGSIRGGSTVNLVFKVLLPIVHSSPSVSGR